MTAGPRRVAAALGCGLVLLAACGGGDERPPAAPAVPAPERPAYGSVRLRGDRDAPLALGPLVRIGPGRYVAADALEPVLWELRPSAETSAPRRLPRLLRDSARFVAIARGPAGVGLLVQDGRLLVWDPTSGAIAGTTRPPQRSPGQTNGLYGLPDGGWVELRTELADRGGSRMRIALYRHDLGRSGSRPLWQRPAGGPWAANLDFSALAGVADTLHVSRASPPRVVRIAAARPDAAVETRLRGAPALPLPASLRREMAAEIARSPLAAGRIEPPELLPAVLRAWPREEGWLALAATGEETVGLDRYCRGTYRRTLVATPALRDAEVLGDVIVLHIAETAADDRVLAFYDASQFPLECAESSP